MTFISRRIAVSIFQRYRVVREESEDNTVDEVNDEEEQVDGQISLFHLKCALVELVGKTISMKDIKRILESLCEWNSSSVGISFIDFFKVVREVEKALYLQSFTEEELLYQSIDVKNKGWIDKVDFMTLLDNLAPHVATSYGEELFAALDIYTTGKIPKPTVISWLQSGASQCSIR